jgi:adenylyltransferase/sulfurtransferase
MFDPLRYSRQTILPEIGIEGQARLQKARVLVVGAGGLGCPLLLYLSAAGVGTIGIVDGDTVNLSNLQRQVLYDSQDIGKMKVDMAQKKLLALNPNITINTYSFYLNKENCLSLFQSYDIIVDGTDHFATRYLINDACVITNKIHVYGALYKFEGQVSVFNYKSGPTYRCLFPHQPAQQLAPNCAEIGVLGVVAGIVGTQQALETLKIILGIGEVLSGKLWTYDGLTNSMHHLLFEKSTNSHSIKTLAEYDITCNNVPEITYQEYLEWKKEIPIFLIDVRNKSEYAEKNIQGHLMPLEQLDLLYTEIPTDQTIVVHCASGMRSKKAVELLLNKGFGQVYHIKNGLLDVE